MCFKHTHRRMCFKHTHRRMCFKHTHRRMCFKHTHRRMCFSNTHIEVFVSNWQIDMWAFKLYKQSYKLLYRHKVLTKVIKQKTELISKYCTLLNIYKGLKNKYLCFCETEKKTRSERIMHCKSLESDLSIKGGMRRGEACVLWQTLQKNPRQSPSVFYPDFLS